MEEELEEKGRIIEELQEDLIKSATLGKGLLDRNYELEQQLKEQEDFYTEKIDDLEQENFVLRNKIETHERLVSEQFSDLEQMRSASQERDREHLELEKLQVTHTKTVARLEGKVSELIDELDGASRSYDTLKEKLERQELLLSEWKEKANNKSNTSYLEVEMGSLQSTVAQLERENDELLVKLQDEEAVIKALRSTEEKHKTRITAIQEEADERIEEISSLHTALQATKEKNMELTQEVQMLKMDSENSTKRKGNSLFSEVEDRRIETEKRFISLKVKHESLEKAHTLAQHQLRKLKVLTSSCTRCCTTNNFTQYDTKPATLCLSHTLTPPPPIKGYTALFGQHSTERVGKSPPSSKLWTSTSCHLISGRESLMESVRGDSLLSGPIAEISADCDYHLKDCISTHHDSALLTREDSSDTLWYDYGDICCMISSSATSLSEQANIPEDSESMHDFVEMVKSATASKEGIVSNGYSNTFTITASKSVVTSPSLRSPPALSDDSNSSASWSSDFVVIASPDREEMVKQISASQQKRRRSSSQKGVVFLRRQLSGSAGRGRRRSSLMSPGPTTPLNNSDLSFYSCCTPKQPPLHSPSMSNNSPSAPTKEEPLNSLVKTVVLYMMARVFKSVFRSFKRRSH